MTFSANWTDEQITELRRLWDQNYSGSEIGKALGRTKNSVIGKAHKLKLPPRPSPIKPRSGNIAPMPSAKRSPIRKFARVRTSVKYGVCAFPMWDHKDKPTHEYCGLKTKAGSVYCQRHHEKCYTKAR